MARIDYWQYLVDKQGNPLQETDVRVYLAGTLNEADIYLSSKFGSVTKSSIANLKTDTLGFVQFWVGDEFEIEGGYEVDQQFKVVWLTEEIDNLYLYTPVKKVEVTTPYKSDRDLDKVISNTLGHKWNTHVDSIVPSASPHDLQPVEFFDLDGKTNRVISDKLGYQMYEMARTASITPIDVSASRFYSENVTSWSGSASAYYKDITHNFDNYYPIVSVFKISNDYQIIPSKVEAINPNVTRIWVSDNISVSIGIFG